MYLVVFLPVLGAYLAHAPVLRYDLLRSLKRPLDGGAKIRGRRVFGDNKTWRGAIVMFAGTFVAAVVLCRFGWYREGGARLRRLRRSASRPQRGRRGDRRPEIPALST